VVTGLQGAFERVGAAIEHQLPVTHAPGLVLAITDREEILGVVCRGMADVAAGAPVRPETRFQIGSISKSFASLIVLQEVEAGHLDLHVSVNRILPWLELPEPFGPVTLHHLMTHTAGLMIGTEDAPTQAGALHRLRTNPPTTAPGERYLYSNDGWKIVGACLEEVTGVRIDRLLQERILGPLGMTSAAGAIVDTDWDGVAVGYEPLYTDRPVQLRHPLRPAPRIVSFTADGSIVSNVVDMCAYARLVLAGGDVDDGRGGRMLSDAMFAEWVEPRVDDGEGGTYGYGLWTEEVDGVRWIAHSGGMVGYTAYLAVTPDEGLGCVILRNGSGSGMYQLLGSSLATVRAALAGSALPPVPIPPPATHVPHAEDFVGRYEGEDGRVLELEALESELRLAMGPVRVVLEQDPLAWEPADTFLVPHDALERYPLVFGRNESGRVVEAFHGDTWFRGEAYDGPGPEPAPEAWRRLPGLYRNDDPWSPVLRIVLRKGRLALQWPSAASDEDPEHELVPLEDGWFAAGTVRDPRRIRFLGETAGGAPAVAEFNGGQWFRSPED
jgi:CubicO group peptidase (beta-lactamase class C family)